MDLTCTARQARLVDMNSESKYLVYIVITAIVTGLLLTFGLMLESDIREDRENHCAELGGGLATSQRVCISSDGRLLDSY